MVGVVHMVRRIEDLRSELDVQVISDSRYQIPLSSLQERLTLAKSYKINRNLPHIYSGLPNNVGAATTGCP